MDIWRCPKGHLKMSNSTFGNAQKDTLRCLKEDFFNHFANLFLNKNMTWEEALNYCRDTYTDLASLTSYEENALAVRKSTAAEVSHVWIGLHFVVRYWIWVDGHALEYQAWSEDENPKCPARNLRCGALETDTNTWTHRDCGEKLNFLCYKK
ncbi:lithostathine-1-beta-like [Astyanax mexicanus]|uniref:Lithostathine-1-beta-like n=1 Tax=Astyanax mexicanus TaxID=7994 RepID=A0A8T2LRT3_ASTMX|nr:lithostathine-1-beta-like [Astyanax mexicanus]